MAEKPDETKKEETKKVGKDGKEEGTVELLLCPNEGCGECISWSEIDAHLKICPYAAVQCPMSGVGCQLRDGKESGSINVADILRIETQDEKHQHSYLLANMLKDMSDSVNELKAKLSDHERKIKRQEFTIQQQQEKQRHQEGIINEQQQKIRNQQTYLASQQESMTAQAQRFEQELGGLKKKLSLTTSNGQVNDDVFDSSRTDFASGVASGDQKLSNSNPAGSAGATPNGATTSEDTEQKRMIKCAREELGTA